MNLRALVLAILYISMTKALKLRLCIVKDLSFLQEFMKVEYIIFIRKPQRPFVDSINFLIDSFIAKHPNQGAVIKLRFKKSL